MPLGRSTTPLGFNSCTASYGLVSFKFIQFFFFRSGNVVNDFYSIKHLILLLIGMGKGGAGGGRDENRDAYLQLSITVLSAFCRVPEIAASEDMVTKIPLILEVLSQEYGFCTK